MIKSILNFIEFDFGQIIVDLIFGLIIGVFVFSGVLTLRSGHAPDQKSSREVRFLDSTICTTVVFAAAVVYLVFVLFQVEYLFIGLQLPDGMTYSEYAHKGVAELSWAVALTFLVCAAMRAFTRKNENNKLPIALRCALTLVTVSSAIVCLSAFYRIFMYIDVYGMTVARISAILFIAFITLSLLILVIALWIEKLRIAPFVVALAVFMVCLFSIANVDRISARVNIDRHLYQGKEIDYDYMIEDLSCDITPELDRLYTLSDSQEDKDMARGMIAMYYHRGSVAFSWENDTEAVCDVTFYDWTISHQNALKDFIKHGRPSSSAISTVESHYRRDWY